MDHLRRFTLLGLPARAIRLNGPPNLFALSQKAKVAAASTDQSNVVVTLDNSTQFCVLHGDWSIKRSAVVAKYHEDIVAAAEGGAFRVDIGEGANFLCDPKKLLGTLGPVQSRLVYSESRFDMLKELTRQTWKRTASLLRSAYGFSKHWLGKIPIPKRVQSIEPPRLPEVPTSVKEYWNRGKNLTRRAWHWVAESSFDYTHPPKLEIKGPCSVLVKP